MTNIIKIDGSTDIIKIALGTPFENSVRVVEELDYVYETLISRYGSDKKYKMVGFNTATNSYCIRIESKTGKLIDIDEIKMSKIA